MANKVFNFFSHSNRDRDDLSFDKAAKQRQLTFVNFFPSIIRRFRAISTANLLFSVCNIWIVAVLLGTTGNYDTFVSTAADPLYAQLYGIMGYENSPVTAMLHGALGVTSTVKIWSSASIFLVSLSILILFTNGIANVGMHYLLRASVTSDYSVTSADFFTAIKKNFKQGFVFGIFDVLIFLLLGYDFIAYQANASVSFVYQMMFYLIIIIALFYIVVRTYIYLMIVSFDFKLGKIIKNALLLGCLGIKRHLGALLGVALFILLNFYILVYIRGIGFLLPFVVTIGLCIYTLVYAEWKVIEQYVIDPYYREHPEERPDANEAVPEGEPIYNDWQ